MSSSTSPESDATISTTPPSAISSSPLMAVRETPNAGRGVFATRRIPAGTPLLVSPSPTTHVLFREYRREVCGECFAYDRGVTWKLRDLKTGLVFCSAACQDSWRSRYDETSIAVEAMAAVEKLASKARISNCGPEDTDMLDVAGSKPSALEICKAWEAAEEETGKLIRSFRCKESGANGLAKPTKAERKAAMAALAAPTVPDVVSYLLSAVLAAHDSPELWNKVLELHPASTPYTASSILSQHILAYYQLLAVLPAALLSIVTPEVLLAASTRESHNSFGLRSLDDGGSEMFGFGIWPSASYWNHSCAPNIGKKRIGRAWLFESSSNIEEGTELCITYLGGEERDLSLEQRRDRLLENWSFICSCPKCAAESADTKTVF